MYSREGLIVQFARKPRQRPDKSRDHRVIFVVTSTMRYNDATGWTLGYLWSLAVEEQFYLLRR